MSRSNDIALGAAIGLVLGWITASPTEGEKLGDARLWDVVSLGPWLILVAMLDRPLTHKERIALAVAGGATISHNGRNMLVRRYGTEG